MHYFLSNYLFKLYLHCQEYYSGGIPFNYYFLNLFLAKDEFNLKHWFDILVALLSKVRLNELEPAVM